MTSAFVGTKTCTETELKILLTQLQTEKSYYFQRWSHQVTGFIQTLPYQLSPAGQLFDGEKELRWRSNSNQFQLLLLSKTDFSPDFLPIPGNWETQEVNAIFRQNETRFPKKIKGEIPKNLAQRYFLNGETATIHFIALTLKK